MKQTNTFQSGDSVVWANHPWPTGHRDREKKIALLQETKNRLGSGPFIVKTVVPVIGRDQIQTVLHPQWLVLQKDGKIIKNFEGFPRKISGVFFKKVV